ncbi:pimeloyl-ACP methyl ester carboxylesterase [Amycolatopsis thermoflava]|uniref:Pimeloyl-ACP methyl ester carboxylesterase n=2 Tax=Amycolatopsis thermoflava TaxID=84480 RepID=A0A3N2GPQ1_9PSEU|nr:pimeloyl-ACP methyl ester carboxylesterase [Amycolatopsis thermoflava]
MPSVVDVNGHLARESFEMISRRLFGQTIAAGAAAASLAACSPKAAPAAAPAPGADLRTGSGEHTSLGPVKQVTAGVLDMGYFESGPATGTPVVLLHGWPYDPYSYVDVAPLLAAQGYRVIVPFLRGYGSTTFLSGQTVRNGQQSAIALDVIALLDALKIDEAVFGGYDWGSRTAAIIAALWPERVKALVAVSGYLITNLAANQQPLAPAAELGWWYQYYFATERGVLGYTKNRHDFNKLIWTNASPAWNFDDATFDRSAAAFENPDHVAIVVHNYRWRLSLAPGEPQYDVYEQKLQTAPAITVPTITIGSDFDGPAADGMAYRSKFTGKYDHRVFAGIGHNVPQEAPQPFARAIVDADHL